MPDLVLEQTKSVKNRVWEVDFIRGVLVLLMAFDHFFYDWQDIVPMVFFPSSSLPLREMVDFASWYWALDLRKITRYVLLALFFAISGICTNFSRSNLKRGLILVTLGLGVGCLTYLYTYLNHTVEFIASLGFPDIWIPCNLFICYGLSILFYDLVKYLYFRFFKDLRSFSYIILILALIFIGLGIAFGGAFSYTHNVVKYSPSQFLLYLFGVYRPSIFNLEYWPLFPYVGYVFFGAYIGMRFYPDKKSLIFKDESSKVLKRTRLVTFFGRHSLWFYVLHQLVLLPVVLFVAYLLSLA